MPETKTRFAFAIYGANERFKEVAYIVAEDRESAERILVQGGFLEEAGDTFREA